jgi:hypothetical protein
MRGIELNTDKENLTKSVVSEVLSSGIIKPSMQNTKQSKPDSSKRTSGNKDKQA